MAGRPSKYTSERIERIVEALKGGNTRRAASAAGGIDENTFGVWMHRFGDFRDAVRAAESEAELAHVEAIKAAAAEGDWRASAWWLERRYAEDWGRKDKVEIIESARQMARQAGATPEEEAAAVAEAEQVLRDLRKNAR